MARCCERTCCGKACASLRRPAPLLRSLRRLPRGRAAFKTSLAEALSPDPRYLPYNDAVLSSLRELRSAGRRLVLVTASPDRWARWVADHLGVFDEVIATSAARNLKGRNKAEALVQRFGEGAFDYAGNSGADLAVWAHARRAWVVAAPAHVSRRARRLGNVDREFPAGGSVQALLGSLRFHQWVKNALVFLPLLAAHAWDRADAVAAAAIAFVAFGGAASAGYLLNDLADLEADRRHPRKRGRPLAAGALQPAIALASVLVLIGACALLASLLPAPFGAVLAGYGVTTVAYSVALKRAPLVDVLVLAGLYALRVLGGSAATAIQPSFWLLAFCMFLFFSLALVKRYAELRSSPSATDSGGRGYGPDDLPLVLTLGTAAGYLAVLVLALYIDSDAARALYRLPAALWVLCPLLLLWISRIWLKAHRGQMHDDPVLFTVRDGASHVTLALAIAAAWIAR